MNETMTNQAIEEEVTEAMNLADIVEPNVFVAEVEDSHPIAKTTAVIAVAAMVTGGLIYGGKKVLDWAKKKQADKNLPEKLEKDSEETKEENVEE